MNPIIRLAAVAAGIISVTAVASAKTYDCTPKAILAKAVYTKSVFEDFVTGKYAGGKGNITATLQKVWDGKGDCDPNGNAISKLDSDSQTALAVMHYYGDVMTVSVMVPQKDFKDARSYVDDFMGVHGAITGPLKAGFAKEFWDQDGGSNGIYAAMKSFNTQITKAGYKPAQ